MRVLGVALLAFALTGCLGPFTDDAAVDSAPCGKLALALSSSQLDMGGRLVAVERFSNCGDVPIRLDGRACSSLTALRVLGAGEGYLDQDGFTTIRLRCGPESADRAAITVLPHSALERRYAWNGTIDPFCVGTTCVPRQSAPSGRYLLTAHLDALDTLDTWETTSGLMLAAWLDPRGNWTEFHPAWLPGPASFTWERAPGVLSNATVPDGWMYATDGRTYLYANPMRLDHDALQESACRSQGPPSAGSWVIVGAASCAWAPYPAMACLPSPEPDPCRAALGFTQGSSG